MEFRTLHLLKVGRQAERMPTLSSKSVQTYTSTRPHVVSLLFTAETLQILTIEMTHTLQTYKHLARPAIFEKLSDIQNPE